MTTRTRSARARYAAIPIATLASLERSLWDRRDQLSRRVGTIDADLRSAHDRDSQERAGERENDEVLMQLDEMSLAELDQIREALQRIQNGTYGTCAGCGSRSEWIACRRSQRPRRASRARPRDATDTGLPRDPHNRSGTARAVANAAAAPGREPALSGRRSGWPGAGDISIDVAEYRTRQAAAVSGGHAAGTSVRSAPCAASFRCPTALPRDRRRGLPPLAAEPRLTSLVCPRRPGCPDCRKRDEVVPVLK